MSICKKCGKDDDTRLGYCFECASEGDLRLGKRSVMQHVMKGFSHFCRGWFFEARCDFKCAYQRLTRTGDYGPNGEWRDL